MNDPSSQPDAELDRLLAARLRRTSPEFELRWRELRAGFASEPGAVRRSWFVRWWPGVATAALGALALVVVLQREPAPAADTAVFHELLTLEAALSPATALLEPENRDALLHLTVPGRR